MPPQSQCNKLQVTLFFRFFAKRPSPTPGTVPQSQYPSSPHHTAQMQTVPPPMGSGSPIHQPQTPTPYYGNPLTCSQGLAMPTSSGLAAVPLDQPPTYSASLQCGASATPQHMQANVQPTQSPMGLVVPNQHLILPPGYAPNYGSVSPSSSQQPVLTHPPKGLYLTEPQRKGEESSKSAVGKYLVQEN